MRRWFGYGGLLALVVAFLNVTGFCWSKLRFVSDDELINSVLDVRSRYVATPLAQVTYGTTEQLRLENPDCCRLKRNSNPGAILPAFIESACGFTMHEVIFRFRINNDGPDQFYQGTTWVSSCGHVRRTMGDFSA